MNKWTIKLDDNEKPILQDGKILCINPQGAEIELDIDRAMAKIPALQAENKTHRERNEELEKQVKILEGIDNPNEWMESAKKALNTVKNLDDKSLVDAGEVEKIKAATAESFTKTTDELKRSHQEKENGFKESLQSKDAAIRKLLIQGAFDSSDFIREKTVLVPSIAYSHFSNQFEVTEKDGTFSVIAKYANGEDVFSNIHPGEPADTAEAIQLLIEKHPDRDSILKGEASGSGSSGSKSSSGSETYNQKDWLLKISSATSKERTELMQKHGSGKINVVD